MAAMTVLGACASEPVPDWKQSASSSTELGARAWMEGKDAIDLAEFNRARREVRATGRPEELAKVELFRCATRTATLDDSLCEAFEPLAPDVSEALRAYDRYIAGQAGPGDAELLPGPHRPVAQAGAGSDFVALLNKIEDPLSRLVAAGVLYRRQLAGPGVAAVGVETASAQGWRRPLLAWLMVTRTLAEAAGQTDAAQAAQRRMDLVAPPVPPEPQPGSSD
ncbi:hypothetical protein NBRC116584_34660 [Hydrogenophaga sp. 5NK40-0174]